MNLSDAFSLQVLRAAEEETHGWKNAVSAGRWVESRSGNRIPSVNPAYDEKIADVPAGNAEDIQAAVDAGKAAFPRGRSCMWMSGSSTANSSWRRFVPAPRIGNARRRRQRQPLHGDGRRREEGRRAARILLRSRHEIKGETIPTPVAGLDYTRPQPFGVVGRIIPFNHPISFAAERSRRRSWRATR
jgi:betaine-aldehyde dehydrogenase